MRLNDVIFLNSAFIIIKKKLQRWLFKSFNCEESEKKYLIISAYGFSNLKKKFEVSKSLT